VINGFASLESFTELLFGFIASIKRTLHDVGIGALLTAGSLNMSNCQTGVKAT